MFILKCRERKGTKLEFSRAYFLLKKNFEFLQYQICHIFLCDNKFNTAKRDFEYFKGFLSVGVRKIST